MKKNLLLLVATVFSMAQLNAQCIPTCSVYAVSAIPFTTFPTGGTNIVSQLTPNTDDGITPLIPLNFSFNFYCTTYTNLWICSNGFIQFNTGVPAIVNGYSDPTQSFPSPTAPNGMVALNMNDLDLSSSGAITYTNLGTSPNQTFVVTFMNVPVFNYPTSLNTGQIVLYEGSNIIDIYTSSVINGGITNGTQGIEDGSGTLGATVPGRNNVIWSASNSAYRFAPYSPVAPSSILGSTSLCAGAQSTYSIAPSQDATSYIWTAPAGWPGSSTTTVFNSSVGSSGSVQVAAVYTCGTSAPTNLFVNALPAPIVSMMADSPIICSGQLVTITPTGAVNYTLEPGPLNSTTNFLLNPSADVTYTLYGEDANGCVSYNNPYTMITVNVTPTITVNSGSVCPGQTFTITASGTDFYSYSNGFPIITQSTPGMYSYSVVGTATNGCSSSTLVSTLVVFPNPTVSITASNNRLTICQNEQTILTAHGGDTYMWSGGTTTGTFIVTPSANFLTTYTVTGTNANGGCSKTATIKIVTDPCTGIEELSATSGKFISAYPNPSDGAFNLTMTRAATVEIYDIQGKLVIKQTVEAGNHTINMSSANAGQYLLKATGENASQSVVLIKE